MHVYRIARQIFADDLTGEGARLFGGRWNRPGTAVLYTAESRSLAAVEYLVHVPLQLFPADLSIAEIEVPQNCSMITVGVDKLPVDWNASPAPAVLSDMVETWKYDRKALCLRVPSVVIDGEWNILINPSHSLFSNVSVVSVNPFTFDTRLLRVKR